MCHCQGLRKVAIEELSKVEAQLAKEAKEDADLRERHGAAWHRPSSAALNSTLMEKIAGAPNGSMNMSWNRSSPCYC